MNITKKTKVKVTATAYGGYEFHEWNNGETSNPFITTVGDVVSMKTKLKAKFIKSTTPEPSEKCPNNQIWYTTTTGETESGIGGSSVVSNTYTNGKGIIEFSSDITTITSILFSGATTLKTITFPASVNSFMCGNGGDMFNSDALETIYYEGTLSDWCNITFDETNVTSNPMYRAEHLYINGEKLEGNVTIPSDITTIKRLTFAFCEDITGITLHDNVTSIGNSAFFRSVNISSINIPNSVTTIENFAMSELTSLTSIEFTNNITTFGDGVLSGSTSLKNVILPSNMTIIPERMFAGTGIEKIAIPSTVTTIGKLAFNNCSSLEMIDFPANVSTIGQAALQNCGNVERIYLKYTTEDTTEVCDLGQDAFSSAGRNIKEYEDTGCPVYVPGDLLSEYETRYKDTSSEEYHPNEFKSIESIES